MNRSIGMIGMLLATAVTVSLAAPTPIQDKTKHGAGAALDEMAQAMMKAAAVGPQHEKLKALTGRWNVQGKYRMGPDAPWQEQKSTCTGELIIGGRFLEQHYQGEPMMGSNTPFEGIAIIGYDNGEQKYVSSWMDSMSTMMLTSQGTSDDGGKTITLRSGEFTCPMNGQRLTMKTVFQIEGNDRFVIRGYTPGPDGKEFQGMELVHSRSSTDG